VGKSRLSTDEMKRLRKAGINFTTIAKLAGITLQGVRTRINPKYQYNPDEYEYAPDRKYLAKARERQREYQQISLKHARHFGAWTSKEIRFLKKNAPELTVLELAIELRRTYYAVNHFVARHQIKTRK